MPEETKTIVLKRPLSHLVDGQPPVTELRLREPRADVLIEAARHTNPAEQSLEMLSAVTGVPSMMLRKMPVAQFNEACAFLNQFTRIPVIAPPEDPDAASATFKLSTPIADPVSGVPITELTLAEPTVDDLIAGAPEASLLGTEAVMLARVTKVDIKAIRKMTASDFMTALGWLGFFTNRPLEIGATLSPT